MQDYYCPNCFNQLEKISGCGTVGYMCNSCKHLVSKQKILTEKEMEKAKKSKEDPVEQ